MGREVPGWTRTDEGELLGGVTVHAPLCTVEKPVFQCQNAFDHSAWRPGSGEAGVAAWRPRSVVHLCLGPTTRDPTGTS